ncbi:outer membrane protein assembly factor BamA [Novosphingobium marinum]|uniref:Outer membrane protein assembly factor BamA n=1 Tax=Novosphingobium marinum TaxID=1514948 RepID=A0A7Z0BU95_9SPHN|nr:outer membrane protein assembly factor BamA [Novosphingobium marinum]NYH96861.1 outer membrane protein insertion porin family [Novosphingobium marinum]GGC41795.1 outer membrane protein assembly factor BamA [Novosphingobium marinum]
MGSSKVRGTQVRRSSQLAAVLMGTTVLAGVPASAWAQDAGEAAPATPATAQAQASDAVPPPPPPANDTIRSLAVVGSQRLEPTTILSYIRLRAGMEYTQAAADQALKDLYATELFSDVQIRNDDGRVVIQVQENPVVNRIILEGNKRIKDDKILPEIKVAPRQIFTRSKVRADVARIIELYKRQGRYAATVEPKMVMLDQNRVDIVFEITEGDKSKVRQINIIGNEEFSDGELRGEMVTKQSRFFRLFSSSTSYDPDRLAFDQQKLRQFYLTEGYADFRVVSAVAELTPDKRDFIITYVVEEGERYKFGDIEVDSQLRDFDSEALESQLPMKQGDWYNAKLVEDTIERLNETAGTFGYAFADVRPRYDRSKDDLTMGITFVIGEAPRVYVERIDVNGNTLTQDKVLRREFRLAEGDAFNSLAVKRSSNRIKSLGYFQEKFEIEQKPGSAPDRIVLEANVEERPTGQLQLSAGFSSIERFIIQASIQQRNFRGRGQTVGLSGSYSRYSKSIEASFTEPYVFDRNVSAGIDVYRRDLNSFNYFRRNRNTTYEQSTTGFQVRAGLPLTEYLTAVARYTLNYDDISLDRGTFFTDRITPGTEQCDPLLAGRYLCEAIGKRTSSILGMSLIYDTTDNRIRPTRGMRASITGDFAGLGGSVKFARFRANAAQYWPIFNNFIFSISAEGGAIKSLDNGNTAPGVDDVRLTDRFFLGEPQIRGFDIRGVGPRVVRKPYVDADGDPDTPLTISEDRDQWTDDALGGKYYYMARAELEIPLGSGARELGLRPSVFVDAGAVFGIANPILQDYPDGVFIPTRDSDGNQLYTQIDAVNDECVATKTSTTTNPNNPTPPSCLTDPANTPIGSSIGPFREFFLGDTWKPRVSVGIGVNWNSPFGPFRIDFAKVLLKREGDDTKTFTFNVGTQF